MIRVRLVPCPGCPPHPVQLVPADVVRRPLDRRHLVVTALLAPVRVSPPPPHQTSSYVEAAVIARQHLLAQYIHVKLTAGALGLTDLAELVVVARHLLESREVLRVPAVRADALLATRAVGVVGANGEVAVTREWSDVTFVTRERLVRCDICDKRKSGQMLHL